MNLLVVMNQKPYDGTDVTWNALRLILQAQRSGIQVKIFLMNKAVELCRQGLLRGEDYDLQGMLLEAMFKGSEAKVCKTCLGRNGIGEEEVRSEVKIATMTDLVEWVKTSERQLSF